MTPIFNEMAYLDVELTNNKNCLINLGDNYYVKTKLEKAKEISKRAQDYMREEESLDYREALREIINDLVSGEDDGLYYNFNEQCYEDIIDDIENKYPCDERYEQLKLF